MTKSEIYIHNFKSFKHWRIYILLTIGVILLALPLSLAVLITDDTDYKRLILASSLPTGFLIVLAQIFRYQIKFDFNKRSITFRKLFNSAKIEINQISTWSIQSDHVGWGRVEYVFKGKLKTGKTFRHQIWYAKQYPAVVKVFERTIPIKPTTITLN